MCKANSIVWAVLMTMTLTLSTALAASAAPAPWQGHPPDPCTDLIVYIGDLSPLERIDFFLFNQFGCGL